MTSPRALILLRCLGITAAMALSSCTLYFGEGGYSDNYDGGYDDGNGYYCSTDTQCAAGCYCSTDGYCEEAGYCSTDADCYDGYLCDEARGSCDPDGASTSCFSDYDCLTGSYCNEGTGECVPSSYCSQDPDCGDGFTCDNGTCIPTNCTTDADCAAGCYCDPTQDATWGGCAESCYCSSDAEAQGSGYGYCDEDRSTCMPGVDPDQGSCAGELTCALGAPTCDPGSVPLIKDGCYSGECIDLAQCDAVPTCGVLNTEDNCLDRDECTPVYTGTDCTTPTGAACQAGDGGCTCANYEFNECRA